MSTCKNYLISQHSTPQHITPPHITPQHSTPRHITPQHSIIVSYRHVLFANELSGRTAYITHDTRCELGDCNFYISIIVYNFICVCNTKQRKAVTCTDVLLESAFAVTTRDVKEPVCLKQRQVDAGLAQERAEWRKDHPAGFSAKYSPMGDGKGLDIMKWICKIPGKKVRAVKALDPSSLVGCPLSRS
ncbi:SUMO-conjugating enzyme UBC9, putative [Plasmodium ovale wallikeri]|uniref:SUMO-conjugating enzyme UBC9, putative n=1 Tax=Plasmodium ovale wallikeri TaxID=864142 RepID=A0A1A9AJV1_PLAOA|nr:SUMO-conjugating enzyme UBC9, putative [Plasmodium ovale wallikeri]SBT56460.1 SUMO-conjugating enzyme UBC9, putative [Plasmodium ovale wallikeri]